MQTMRSAISLEAPRKSPGYPRSSAMIGPGLRETISLSATPVAVGLAIGRLVDHHRGLADRLEDDPRLGAALVAVAGASRFLSDLCMVEPAALSALSHLDQRHPVPVSCGVWSPTAVGELRRWKRVELLRIAARDLLGVDDLPEVGRALAAMAADVLQGACRMAGVEGLAVIGMGKLGGAELNYASDVDLMLVAADATAAERGAREALEVTRSCFRVDVNLRPEGRSGPLVRSLASYEAYWDRWAQTWEFQALLKARPVAGDPDLGQAFVDAARRRLWKRPFTAADRHSVRSLKARAEGELSRAVSERDVKLGPGGIRDIEFAVQLLQLVHGGDDVGLRSPTTLDALWDLTSAGHVDPADARTLDHAYRVLRTVEQRLQLDREQQVHVLPTDSAALSQLAQVMGYRQTSDASAGEVLAAHLRRLRTAARCIHERLFRLPSADGTEPTRRQVDYGQRLPLPVSVTSR